MAIPGSHFPPTDTATVQGFDQRVDHRKEWRNIPVVDQASVHLANKFGQGPNPLRPAWWSEHLNLNLLDDFDRLLNVDEAVYYGNGGPA